MIAPVFQLTKSKSRALALLYINLATVFFGTMVIPVFTGGLDLFELPVVLFGLLFFLFSAVLALFFGEKGKL